MTDLLKIGLTGGIGSGKSYISRLLEGRGIPVYDTDTEAKRLMREHSGIRSALTALLGDETYYSDGTLNKQLIASFLFASEQNAARINAIVHPVVKADFLSWAFRHHGWVAMESAILFESGFSDAVDFIVAVQAPLDVRIGRVSVRDKASEESIRQRIKAQMDDEQRASQSDFVIENDGIRPLGEQIETLFKVLREKTRGL